MEARRLLIAESNEDIRLALARELQRHYYVRCCTTGTEALELIRQERPELVVLSMSLPELDSLTLLETIAAENIRPMVLATTAYHSDYLESCAHRLGIGYILRKPFLVDTIVHRVLDMKEYLHSLPAKPSDQQLLTTLLQPLGILPMHQGYAIAEFAIIRMSADPDRLLCKEVYLDTARHFGTSHHAVESQIRRLMENSWDPDRWQSLFPDTHQHPTAKVFLKRMAQLLRQAME